MNNFSKEINLLILNLLAYFLNSNFAYFIKLKTNNEKVGIIKKQNYTS